MEDFPKTIMELERRFSCEEACRQYLFELRWSEGFCCPRCGHKVAWHMSRDLYLCAGCRFQISVIAGTIFQDTRKPLTLWFRAIWYVTSQKLGVSALGLQRVLGLGSYRTAWTWLHKLRSAMVRPGRDRLSGTVEVDEIYIGGVRKGKRGRGADGKVLVLVIAQQDGRRIGRIRLHRLEDASSASLIAAVKNCVEPGSVVRTDGWKGYLPLLSENYVHNVIRKTSDIGDNLLPRANLVSSLLKRWLLGTHQGAVGTSHLDYYLDEYTFRFNRRTSKSRGKLFYRLMQQAVKVGPLTGLQIRGGSRALTDHNI